MTSSPLLSFFSFFKLLIHRKANETELSSYWHQEKELGIWFSRSAWSIAILSQIRKDQKSGGIVNVWVPEYFCNASLSLLRLTGCQIIFYPVLENFEPDFSATKNLLQVKGVPDIFLLVHYFGKPSSTNRSMEFCANNGAWLVEDAAHVLRPVKGIGEAGDFVLYSPHKLLPIPDGALLVIRTGGPSHLSSPMVENIFVHRKWKKYLTELDVSSKGLRPFKKILSNSIWLLKQALQKCRIKRYVTQPFKEREATDTNNLINTNPEISRISLKILAGIKHTLPVIALTRERNQMLWDYYFGSVTDKDTSGTIQGFRPENLAWTPYMASYMADSQRIQKMYDTLGSKKLLPSTWPDLPPELFTDEPSKSIAVTLRDTRFFLPVHQSLSKNIFRKLLRSEQNRAADPDSTITTEWNNISRESWNSLIQSVGKSNLLQSWAYGEAKNKSEGWTVHRVIFYQGETIVAVSQVLEKRVAKLLRVYRINRGPLFFTNEKEIREAVVKNVLGLGNILHGKLLSVSFELDKSNENIAALLLTKMIALDLKGYSSIWVDMKVSLDTIRKTLNGKWRNMLVFAEKQGLDVESGSSPELVKWACKIHEENMNKKGFKGISSELLWSLAEQSDAGTSVVVYKGCSQGQPVAAVCVAYHGNTATYLIGWTSDEGRKLKANYLLLWAAVKELKDKNMEWFDLGGIDAEATPGITGFKTGMSGKLYSLVPSGWSI